MILGPWVECPRALELLFQLTFKKSTVLFHSISHSFTLHTKVTGFIYTLGKQRQDQFAYPEADLRNNNIMQRIFKVDRSQVQKTRKPWKLGRPADV